MKFEVGETVVYPHHGAAKIVEVKNRNIRGASQKYLQLKVAQGDLTIWVPAANVEMVGVRDVIDRKGVQQVFDVLRAEFIEEPTNWSRRYKANLEKLASGDVVKVSEVVRDLYKSDCLTTSYSQKIIYESALTRLANELALLLDVKLDQMLQSIEELLVARI
jgi:CarD family transcriptional regulator